jgi:hypothetical protein
MVKWDRLRHQFEGSTASLPATEGLLALEFLAAVLEQGS